MDYIPWDPWCRHIWIYMVTWIASIYPSHVLLLLNGSILSIYIYIVSIYTLTLTVQLFVINNSVTLYMYKLNDINDRQMINDRLHLI